MNFVWCVVPSTIIPCWFLFANRIGLLSCMTRRKYDIEWRSDHMSTGVSWWDENNSANLQSRPLELSLAGNTMGCHVSQATHWLSIDGHFCQDRQWSKPLALHSLLCLLFAISSDACPSVCCNAEERGEVYKCFFLWGDYHGHHHCHYHHGPSPAQLLSSGSDQCKVSVGCPPLLSTVLNRDVLLRSAL